MSPARIPGALLEKIGAPASAELIELLDTQQRTLTEAVMSQCAERFERRLVEETSKLRVDLVQTQGDMRQGFAELRGEMHQGFAAVRGEMRQGFAEVRGEMRQGFADIGRDNATHRFELLRWSFAFWVGQLAAVATIVGLLLRTMPAR